MHIKRMSVLLVFLVASALILPACDTAAPGETLTIVSGSENETLEPIIQEWANQNGHPVEMTYMGSVDIARMLQSGSVIYDAIWPANSLWLYYGDTHNLVKYEESIMRSPVVFGLKRSVAERLGWIDKDIYMNDILEAAETGEIRFMMTSATQSNSGASFYFGALTAFAGSPEVLTEEHLEDPDVKDKIKRILGTIDRSSGSSGWLKSLFLDEYLRFDAMVNYEALVIETNLELEQSGREPLYAIYPVDGLAIADSPLGYIDHDNEKKEEVFLALQEHLLSETVQAELLKHGRRVSLVGMSLENADTSVFRSEWGIDVKKVIQPIRFPNQEVIQEALELYQVAFRRPSCTAYVLDFSGSMSGEGENDLKAAMRTLLDQDIAREYLLQGHPQDLTMIVLFNESVMNRSNLEEWTVRGSDPEKMRALYQKIENTSAGGETNIFGSAQWTLEQLYEARSRECLPAVILMTDGQDNQGSFDTFEQYANTTENDIPVFAITFGDASEEQLQLITNHTHARIFHGQEDLVAAFRKAKGYN